MGPGRRRIAGRTIAQKSTVARSVVSFAKTRELESVVFDPRLPRGLGAVEGGLNQLQPLQACMPVLADDDVIVHRYAQRARDVDDGFRHLDIRVRRRRIAGRVIVHQAAESSHCVETKEYIGSLSYMAAAVGSGFRCSRVILTLPHRHPRGVALTHGSSPYSFDPMHQAR